MTPDEQFARWQDYRLWHWLQVNTNDIDPVYPWLRTLAEWWGLDAEQRAWLCVCHVIWYHPGSTIAAFARCSSITDLPARKDELLALRLPTGTERRGHRDTKQLVRHLDALPREMPDGVTGYVGLGDSWRELNDRLAALTGNGRWAAYKLAEMLQKVCGLPVLATDAGHRYSSGPRKGLADLYGADVPGQGDGVIAELDRRTEVVRRFVNDTDVAQVETSLCDFHSAVKGNYYIGRDIDGMQEDLERVSDRIPMTERKQVWEARSVVFDPKRLGEWEGWSGVRSELKRKYRDEGWMA